VHTIVPYTHTDILDAEQALIDAVAAALQAVCDQVADQIGKVVVAAGAPGPPGQPYVSVDDLAVMPSLWTGQMQTLILPLEAQIYQDAAGRTHAEMVDLVGPSVPSIGSEAAEDFIAGAANRWDFVGGDVWENARTQLLDGFQQGESIPQLADRVRGAAGLSQRRATAVARTEVVAASNAGSFATAELSGLDMVKVWLATDDERTRPTHNTADGQRQPLKEPFLVGISSLAFPGDPGGAAEETHNCRCSITYEIPDEVAAVAQERQADFEAPVPEAELAARARQADIDEARKVATAAAEVDELVNNGVSADGLRKRITATAARTGMPDGQRDEWLAQVDHPERLLVLADEAAANAALTPIGRAGDVVAFDRKIHKPVAGETFRDGQVVEIFRRGYSYRRGDEDIQLSKAVVEETDRPLPTAPTPMLSAEPDFSDRQSSVRALAEQDPVTEPRRLGGGYAADTHLLDYGNGRMLVRKTYGPRQVDTPAEAKRQADAEVLGAMILDAVGVRAPAVVATSKRGQVVMEFLEGHTWAESSGRFTGFSEEILNSPDGIRMGLADLLMLNLDRNQGNVLIQGTRLGGIDHGYAFALRSTLSSLSRARELHPEQYPFAGFAIDGSMLRETFVIPGVNLSEIRSRLEALSGQFEQQGRARWHREMMARLAEIEKRAV
jgi:hypothetical protein